MSVELDIEVLEASYLEVCEAWQLKNVQSRIALEQALEPYKINFAYNSGVIENDKITYYDTRAIFEKNTVGNFSGDVRTLFEISNQKDWHNVMLDSFEKHRPVTVEFLLEAHEILTKGTYSEQRWNAGERPGSFKKNDYVVGVNDTGIDSLLVHQEIANLLDQCKIANQENVFTVAAFFHAMFEGIHPFADGNGRVGRAIMNYLLVLNNHPPIIVFESDKLAYYGALEVWDTDADLEPLKMFLKAELIKTWQVKTS